MIIKSASTGRENFNENVNTLISYPAIDLTELPKLEFIDLKNLSPSDRHTMHEYLLSKLGVLRFFREHYKSFWV